MKVLSSTKCIKCVGYHLPRQNKTRTFDMKNELFFMLIFASSINCLRTLVLRDHPDQKVAGNYIFLNGKYCESILVADYRDMGNVWINALGESDPDYVEMMSDMMLGGH